MKTTVSMTNFHDAFYAMEGEDQFSYEGLCALYEYFEELDADTGIETELDVIGICCDFAEYSSWEEFKGDHPDTAKKIEDSVIGEIEDKDVDFVDIVYDEFADLFYDEFIDLFYDELLDKLGYYTQVIDIDGKKFIIQNF